MLAEMLKYEFPFVYVNNTILRVNIEYWHVTHCYMRLTIFSQFVQLEKKKLVINIQKFMLSYKLCNIQTFLSKKNIWRKTTSRVVLFFFLVYQIIISIRAFAKWLISGNG